jgi:hypothetical protein
MNFWDMKWDLHVEICPCDVHFNEWTEAKQLAGRTIFHFGTGTHHVVGLRQAEFGNAVFAVTASKEEYEAYIALVADSSRLAKCYLAYFGDIYLSNPRLLPDFDAVTLFHLNEFSRENTASAEYGGCTDRGLLDMMTGKRARADISSSTGTPTAGPRPRTCYRDGRRSSRSNASTISRRCWSIARPVGASS